MFYCFLCSFCFFLLNYLILCSWQCFCYFTHLLTLLKWNKTVIIYGYIGGRASSESSVGPVLRPCLTLLCCLQAPLSAGCKYLVSLSDVWLNRNHSESFYNIDEIIEGVISPRTSQNRILEYPSTPSEHRPSSFDEIFTCLLVSVSGEVRVCLILTPAAAAAAQVHFTEIYVEMV